MTTYQRNRKGLGESAVLLLKQKIETGEYGSFTPPKGTLISGETCGCGAKKSDIQREIKDVQTKATYDFLNLFSQLEHRLTECRNIDEFVARCWDFQFMIRDVNKLYLCLYENWYDRSTPTKNMICYNLLFYEEPLIYQKYEFSCLFREEAAPYYFCPLFFAERELGYVVLRFDHPDTFDHIFRNWLKSISNGLEFLRMKNDIRYLTECQNLSVQRDTLTGMYNDKGMKNAYKVAEKTNLYAVMLRIGLFGKGQDRIQEKVNAVLDVADAVRQFCGNHNVCGKISEDTFLCLVRSKYDSAFLEEYLKAIVCQHTTYMQKFGIDSFVCCAVLCDMETYEECKKVAVKSLTNKLQYFLNGGAVRIIRSWIKFETNITNVLK